MQLTAPVVFLMIPGYSTQHRVGGRRGGSSRKWTPLATLFSLWLITPYASFGFRQILPCPVSLTVCFQSDRSIQSGLSWSCCWRPCTGRDGWCEVHKRWAVAV